MHTDQLNDQPQMVDLDREELEVVEGGVRGPFTGNPFPINGIRVGQWAIDELNAMRKFFGI